MTKYLLKRLVRGLLSIIVVVAIVMILIYSCLDRNSIFATDPDFTHQLNNKKEEYKYVRWEEYGYVDYVPYTEFLTELTKNGEIDQQTRDAASKFARKADKDDEIVSQYVAKFTEKFESEGYTVIRRDAIMNPAKPNKVQTGGQQLLFAYKDKPLLSRLWNYFTGLFSVDNIHYAEKIDGERGLTFTMHDPVYGGDVFSPAIIGNGTRHRYLLYFDDQFPWIHQNLLQINLGKSYAVNKGIDVFETMNISQGKKVARTVTYPTGLTEEAADDLHTAAYVGTGDGEEATTNKVIQARFTDNYTAVQTFKNGMSKVGYSFVIGIISSILAYLLGVPIGIAMARKKDKLIDKIGTAYIVSIIAIPSLAYIFLFKAIGYAMGLPTTFNVNDPTWVMYVLPIISLALPSVGSLMKWLRRYMIDQMNSDYVKFARSGGLSENEIFNKHILKNAVIPLVHGIPGTILGALTGAIITERVYVVPGAGNMLTTAINSYDNGVIVGMTMFYALLSVVSIILGDILMSMVDPRISFTTKGR